jgi:transcriptional regulator with AAA-type ATPase domain
MVEIWKDIVGYEGLYQVSSLGRVKSLGYGKERILKGFINSLYLKVCLCNNKKQLNFLIHRLVGQAFISNPENKPEINHIDGDKTNNRVDNLEWVTHKENMEHSNRTGLRNNCNCGFASVNINNKGEKHPNCKLNDVQVLEIREKYSIGIYTQQNLADEYNISKTVISDIINKKLWKHI